MTVIEDHVWWVLDEGEPLQPVYVNAPDEDRQDREHTLMFLSEIEVRYAASPPKPLVNACIAAINQHQTITGALIRQQITAMERQLNLPNTEPAVAPGGNAVQLFLEHLAARRGAYTWAPGESEAYAAWVHGPSPLEYPLPITAQINCWEAVLVAAAQSGLVSLGTIRGAYISQDVPAIGTDLADRVFRVLTRGRRRTEVKHAPDTAGANAINAGDVILIEGSTGRLHHVVAVTAPDQANYEKVRVMSLWSELTGGLFGQATLGSLLSLQMRFWYGPL